MCVCVYQYNPLPTSLKLYRRGVKKGKEEEKERVHVFHLSDMAGGLEQVDNGVLRGGFRESYNMHKGLDGRRGRRGGKGGREGVYGKKGKLFTLAC